MNGSFALYKRGPTWHYDFQVAGKRYRRSTKETARKYAEIVAAAAFEEAKREARAAEPTPTLGKLVRLWVAAHRATASDAHIRNVETFARLHLYDLAGKPITKIGTADVEVARAKHLRRHSRSTANKWLAILRLLTLWAVDRGYLQAAPWKVRALKVQKKPKPTLPLSAAIGWLEAVDRAAGTRREISMVVRLILGLGLRISEAVSARWEWIDLEQGVYTPGRTKGREADPIPLPAWLLATLAESRKARGLIAADGKGREADPRAVRDAMRKANEECMLHGITPHRLRGTYATALSAAGVPLQDVKAALRHKDWRTTTAYLEADLERLRRGIREVSRRMAMPEFKDPEKSDNHCHKTGTGPPAKPHFC